MPRVLPLSAASLCAALLAVVVTPPSGHAADAGARRLPDLVQELPGQLEITVGGPKTRPSYHLGFGSAVSNIGDGPLVIDGHRDAATRAMVADQLIDRDGAAPDVVPGVGSLSYVKSPDHQHWHFHGFDHYELRRAGSSQAVVRDRKSGFCLGDRYRVATTPAAAAAQPVYTSRCGLTQPGLLQIREGISVGYGDNYTATLEYQDLALTGLKAGRYVLVHRVNADRRLLETRYDNNAASMLLRLRWRHGVPDLRVLKSCPNGASCASGATARAAAAPSSTRVRTVADDRLLCVLPRPV
jgi:hypothetical protein